MLSRVFALRMELAQELSQRAMSVDELSAVLGRVGGNGSDEDLLKLSIADIVRVEEGRVKLTRDGILLLQLVK